MIKYIVKLQDDSLKLYPAIGFTPEGTIGILPEGEDIRWMEHVDDLETIQVPVYVVDESGEIVLDESGNPTQALNTSEELAVDEEGNPVYQVDENGDPILDENGDPIQAVTIVYGDPIFEDQVINHGKKLQVNETTKASIQAQDISDAAQKTREAKLQAIRSLREPLMKEIDIMVNELTLGDRADTAAIKTYRDELKTLTDPYKDVDGNATSAIDALADDISDLVLPTKP